MNNLNEEKQKLLTMIQSVIPVIEGRIVQYPKFPPYLHALNQVNLIKTFCLKDAPVSQVEKAQIDLGIMCVKTLDEIDEELSDPLHEISGMFDEVFAAAKNSGF